MITQAVILCAGLGTRLRPLTDTMPKQMIPVAGKPLLEHILVRLRDQGVKEFFINLHYLPEAIPAYFGDGATWGVKIVYAHEPVLMGTAGGIKHFERQLHDEFFVVYGDMWNQVDVQKLAAFHRAKGDAVGTVVVANADRSDVDLVELDAHHHFQKFYYRPHPSILAIKDKLLLNAIYVFSKKMLDCISANTYCELDRQVLPAMLARGWKLYGYPSAETVLDVGTFERLEKIRSLVE